jgi:hypothetical protein
VHICREWHHLSTLGHLCPHCPKGYNGHWRGSRCEDPQVCVGAIERHCGDRLHDDLERAKTVVTRTRAVPQRTLALRMVCSGSGGPPSPAPPPIARLPLIPSTFSIPSTMYPPAHKLRELMTAPLPLFGPSHCSTACAPPPTPLHLQPPALLTWPSAPINPSAAVEEPESLGRCVEHGTRCVTHARSHTHSLDHSTPLTNDAHITHSLHVSVLASTLYRNWTCA